MAKQSWKPGNMLYPVPVVMVSCQRDEEKPNIITVAWAGTICSNPPMLSISIRPERYSYPIIKETRSLARAADYCGVESGRKVDKYERMKLTPSVSKIVKVPGIFESPVNMECRVTEVKELGSHHMFLAEIVNVNISEDYLDERGKFHLNQAGMVSYSHGEYFVLGERLGGFGYSVKKRK